MTDKTLQEEFDEYEQEYGGPYGDINILCFRMMKLQQVMEPFDRAHSEWIEELKRAGIGYDPNEGASD